MVPITDCLKKEQFQWGETKNESFKLIKGYCVMLMHWYFIFENMFEVECNASVLGIGAICALV